MIKKVSVSLSKISTVILFVIFSIGFLCEPVVAQTSPDSQAGQLEQLRSDVGIHGLTANLHWLSSFSYMGNDTLQVDDGSSELEFVYRNVRMMSPHVGVGFQLLTSFFSNSGNGGSFGIGSWGLGPVVRAYPLRTEGFQPYVQANTLFGKNLAVSELANTQTGGNGFRVRLGLRAGLALRLSNSVGLFTEAGYDWESSELFKADARAFQFNIGFDFYMFN